MDLTDLGFIPRRPEVIDSSMLKDFIDCPSYFYLRHILGLRKKFPPGTGEAKFDWGTCWHHVMRAYKHQGYSQQAGLEALEEHYPEYIIPSNDKYKRSKERMTLAFFDYVETYQEADKRDFEILRQEQFFDIYDDEVDLRWCGRIDDLMRRTRNSRILVNDYKTSSSMGPNYFNQHELGFQFPGYVWAADHLFAGESVVEIMIDVLYMVTAKHEFFRKTFRYPPPRINEWVSNVQVFFARLWYLVDNHLGEPSKWGLNWNQCTNYGLCDFFPVHSLTPQGSSRLNVLQADYVVDYWDPRNEGKQLIVEEV